MSLAALSANYFMSGKIEAEIDSEAGDGGGGRVRPSGSQGYLLGARGPALHFRCRERASSD